MSAELITLKAKRTAYKAYITKTENYLKANKDNTNIDIVKRRHLKITKSQDEFFEIQCSIEAIEETADPGQEYDTFELHCSDILNRLQQEIDKLESKSKNNTEHDSPPSIKDRSRLPRINLPSFSGLYEEWRPFYDTFDSLIHADTSIPDIQKFHYLKSCLSGKAAKIIQSLSISANSYTIAWNMLKEKYDNKRYIIHQHIKGIVNLPAVSRSDHSRLSDLLNQVFTHTEALKLLERPVDNWDDLLIYHVTSKLDPVTITEWENTLKTPSDIPKFTELIKFLDKRCQTLETVANTSFTDPVSAKPAKVANVAQASKNVCSICSKNHSVYQCDTFLKLSVDERIERVKSKNMCLNCLKIGHRIYECKNSHTCKTCTKKHHTLLHRAQSNNSESSNATVTISNHAIQSTEEIHTLLSTALILINDKKGHAHECRVLLDCGSQSNFITKSLANRLGLKQETISMPVVGINQVSTNINKSVTVEISSRLNGFKSIIKCLVIEKITGALPATSIKPSVFEIPKNIKLADPNFHQSKSVDMLIGVDLFWKLMCIGQIKASHAQPCFQKTHFGWIIAGSVASAALTQETVCNFISNETLDERLASFWKQEECLIERHRTPEEVVCENHFTSHTKRNDEGRYIVRLPFKDTSNQLGDSYNTALKRFFSLERRFKQDPKLKQQYSDFLQEYEDLGHMNLCTSAQINENSYYLPHHAVEKRDSTTTKLRVVFDGSCKTSTRVSLNDLLMVGPTIQQDLFSIVCRFRTNRIALTADIAKMYRQILVDESDRNYQRILWRYNPKEKIKIFNLATVTYGTSAAPFLAIRTLQQLAYDEGAEFPVGAEIVIQDFYVDDMLTGANTTEEGKTIINETSLLLQRGGFELRKWHSSHRELFTDMNIAMSAESSKPIDVSDNIKALGLSWNTVTDTLLYRPPNVDTLGKITKRSILSFVCQLFDPLGLLGPIIIIGKILMQRLWQLKIDWDESIPHQLHNQFIEYQKQLSTLTRLQIPRRVISIDQYSDIELHGFSDASQNAYGACVYIRAVNQGRNSCNLLCARSKVAPLKSLTIPRLELSGALLLCQLIQKVQSSVRLNFSNTYYWTDSTIVLAWIKSTTRQWKTFVANRVNQILELTTIDQWSHVRSEENPADIISRGTPCPELINSNLWWHGPDWLSDTRSQKIPTNTEFSYEEPLPEEKVTSLCLISDNKPEIFSKFSSLTTLIRVISYCNRFVNNCKARVKDNTSNLHIGYLSQSELQYTTIQLVKLIQAEHFHLDLSALRQSGSINSKSKLLTLSPYLDGDGLIRVGGRLKQSTLPNSHKHPIVLPSNHRFTTLIIEYYHRRQLHAGLQGTMAAIRCTYWPLSLKGTARHILRKCITCFKANPRNVKYIMGELPTSRIEQSRPFLNTGIDFCGPFHIRERQRRNSKTYKVYVAIFICLATKAIHIEIVSDLTSEAFLHALKRFTSRRGKPANLYSDNATNFVGVNNELKRMYQEVTSEHFREVVSRTLSHDKIVWHFIPPRSPNFGGLWEAGVKSTKQHLYKVAGNLKLTYEQLHTLLTQIEGILNSRPLIPLSEDPNDDSFLTPSHFLIGDNLTALPEEQLTQLPENRLSHWQHIEQVKQHFWKRWHKEYLNHLQQRTKWNKQGKEAIHPGQLVIVKEDNLPPLRWLPGRVQEVYPGLDGVVRAATVKVRGACIKRPATKLCVLPL